MKIKPFLFGFAYEDERGSPDRIGHWVSYLQSYKKRTICLKERVIRRNMKKNEEIKKYNWHLSVDVNANLNKYF